MHCNGGEGDRAEVYVKGLGEVAPSGVDVHFGWDWGEEVAPVGRAMRFGQRADSSVGAGSDGGEGPAQGGSDGGVERAGVRAGCVLDPKDFLSGVECAEEIGVGCGGEFGEDVTGDQCFVGEVR